MFRGRQVYEIAGGSVDTEEPNAEVYTHPECLNRLDEIAQEVDRLYNKSERTAKDEQYLRDLDTEFNSVDARRAKLEAEAVRKKMEAKLEQSRRQVGDFIRGGGASGLATEGGAMGTRGSLDSYDRDAILEPDSIESKRFRNPWDIRGMLVWNKSMEEVGQEYHARAISAIEKMQGANDKIRKAGTEIVERHDDDQGTLAQLVLAISSPEYFRAWSKMAKRPLNADLSKEERAALARAEQVQRAMSLTDNAGGYLVPFQLDPTVILTSDGSFNEIRQIARQEIAIGDTWNGVSAGAVSWSFDAEAAEVSDDAPAFAGPSIPIRTARGFVPISLEARMDAANVTQEVGRLLAQGKDDLEAIKFATGSAADDPIGIVTALVASSPTVIVTSTTADTWAFNDLYKLQGALPARYRTRASWLANNLTYNLAKQTAPSTTVWNDPGGGAPRELLDRPRYEAESMDGVINATQENYMVIFGDFSNFVIADRIGLTVDFIPHLFGTNRRPTGQSGWFAYYRVGSDSVNDAGFRLLNIT